MPGDMSGFRAATTLSGPDMRGLRSPLTAVAGPDMGGLPALVAKDPFFSSVVLLAYLDGTDGSTSFPDATGRHAMSGAGNAQISTAVAKFGAASLLVDGTGDYVTCTDNLTDFRFGTGDFTVEFWLQSFYSNRVVLDFWNATGNGWQIFLDGTSFPQWRVNGAAIFTSSSATSSIPNWEHWAVSRVGTSLKMFKEGAQVASATDSTNYTGTNSTAFSLAAQVSTRNAAYDLPGRIDCVRITKGVGRYTTTFTPPSVAFPNS